MTIPVCHNMKANFIMSCYVDNKSFVCCYLETHLYTQITIGIKRPPGSIFETPKPVLIMNK